MRHRLILLYGPGSGLGKSTLARSVVSQLELAGHEAILTGEELTGVEAFAPYVACVGDGRADDADILLSCCRAFVETADVNAVHVMDSILPCWDWLATAGCSVDDIAAFTDGLTSMLTELRPLLVWLTGDREVATLRARRQRGDSWASSLAAERADGTLDGLLGYFRRLCDTATALLPRWPFDVVVIDTTANELSYAQDTLLRRLGQA